MKRFIIAIATLRVFSVAHAQLPKTPGVMKEGTLNRAWFRGA